MGRGLVFAVLVLVSLHHPAEIAGFGVNTQLDDEKWQCDAICAGSGGKMEFDMTNKICKCHLGQRADDTDIALVTKRAKMFGVPIETIRRPDFGPIIKREVPTTTVMAEITTDSPTTTENPKEPEEPIVGQQQQRKPQRFAVGQRRLRNEPRPISPEQQRAIMQQMREHLGRLGLSTDQRSRQAEIEAIRANVKQLQETVVVQNPQQRSRMASDRIRGLVQNPKLRMHRLRPLTGPRVGAGAPNATSHPNELEIGISKGKKRPRFEIITQDPRLIVDDEE